MNERLQSDLTIQRVRLVRWEGGQEPATWDREHPERHPLCLEVRVVDEHGLHIVLWERGQAWH